MHTIKCLTRVVVAAAAVSFFAGCASVSVKQESWSEGRLSRPGKIYVADYAAPAEVLRVDRSGAELEEFRKGLGAAFAAELRERISARIAPARAWAEGTRPEKGAWVVEGQFLRVNQGSRILRALVGLGAGGTKFETRTRISEVVRGGGRRPIGEIETTGGSNAEPGLLTSPPLTAPLRAAVSATLTGLTPDQRRTARMITAAMAEKLEAQGYALPGKKEPVKRLGLQPGSPATP